MIVINCSLWLQSEYNISCFNYLSTVCIPYVVGFFILSCFIFDFSGLILVRSTFLMVTKNSVFPQQKMERFETFCFICHSALTPLNYQMSHSRPFSEIYGLCLLVYGLK